MRFRRRSKQNQPEPVLAAKEPATASQAPEDGARELVFAIMRAAPDVRYRAARRLGLIDSGSGPAAGPDFERRLLEGARERRQLAELVQAIQR